MGFLGKGRLRQWRLSTHGLAHSSVTDTGGFTAKARSMEYSPISPSTEVFVRTPIERRDEGG